MSEDLNGCLEMLNQWEITQPIEISSILGMRAAVLLAKGELENSKQTMNECLVRYQSELKINHQLGQAIEMFYAFLNKTEEHEMSLPLLNSPFLPCHEYRQPTGTRIKYLVGVGMILTGIIAAPFSGGASAGLISAGAA